MQINPNPFCTVLLKPLTKILWIRKWVVKGLVDFVSMLKSKEIAKGKMEKQSLDIRIWTINL